MLNRNQKIMLGSLCIVIIGSFGTYKFVQLNQENEKKVQKLTVLKTDLSESMKSLKDLYNERYKLFLSFSINPKQDQRFKDIESKFRFIEINQLQTEAEMIQFDQIQNELSQLMAQTFVGKISKGQIEPKYLKPYQQIERLEKVISDTRSEITKKTMEYNQVRTQVFKKNQAILTEFPLFAAEKAMTQKQ